jgi:hypothetical protein
MPVTFQQIPNWISFENQGGNIATADVDRDGSPELFVLRVDHPGNGPNRAFYRVGKKLDPTGNITGGWGPWIEIPDWGSNDNQGAGIAVANFGAAGLGLVIFQVRHVVPGPNVGLFRVGRNLDANGNVTGGWSNWAQVPNWISWRDQHAAITTGDIDGDGRPELVVFHIDDFNTGNPRLPNKGFYRVAQALDQNAGVASWSDWMEVDWFSWFNQGAGVALADLDGNGRPEIIIFQIDDPPQENAGFYRVGWNLDNSGRVTEGWGPWNQVDGWGSWEDQGGGFALASFGPGRPKAVIFHIDNPGGLNAGLFAVIDLVTELDAATTKGVWRLLPYDSEVLPVHAALLHTGKVLFFAGSGNNAFRFNSPDFGNVAKKIYTSVVWDPSNNVLGAATFIHPATLRRANGSVIDFFCCGHTFLPDGRLLVAGGSLKYDKIIVNGQMQPAAQGFEGTRDALVFDPATSTWSAIQPMTRGRWYPTLVTLSDGTVLATSGLDENGNGPGNNTIERLAPPYTGAWAKTRNFDLPLYPHLFQMQDGTLFYTGGKMDTQGNSQPLTFDPINPTNAGLINGLEVPDKCNQCASVLMPPAQLQQVMILGGGPEDPDDPNAPRGIATQRVDIIDFKGDRKYHATGPLAHERMHVNAVLLPDRTVMAAGGGVTREASAISGQVDPFNFREVLEAEIYTPAARPQDGKWTDTERATIARLYHSVALLLPDGRVVAAGGNPDKGSQVNWLPPDPLEEMRLEIFSPPYLFKKPNRPVISNVPQEIHYGAAVAVRTPKPGDIKWISLIFPGLTTHSFNCTQRLVDVPFTVTLPDTLNATVPNDKNIAPPGWYMLFLVDNDGVPSVASWVHLS